MVWAFAMRVLLLLLALLAAVGTFSLIHTISDSSDGVTVLSGYEHSVTIRRSPLYKLYWSVIQNDTLAVGIVASSRGTRPLADDEILLSRMELISLKVTLPSAGARWTTVT